MEKKSRFQGCRRYQGNRHHRPRRRYGELRGRPQPVGIRVRTLAIGLGKRAKFGWDGYELCRGLESPRPYSFSPRRPATLRGRAGVASLRGGRIYRSGRFARDADEGARFDPAPLVLLKANFNQAQPRVPSGNGRESGVWTSDGYPIERQGCVLRRGRSPGRIFSKY